MSIQDNLKHCEKKRNPDCESIISRQIDIVTLLGFICKELSYSRKETLGPSVHPDFRDACSRNTKPTASLFGDKLTKTIQEVCTTNRILQNFLSRSSRYGAFYRSNDWNTSKRGGLMFIPEENRPIVSKGSGLQSIGNSKLQCTQSGLCFEFNVNSIS